MAFDVEGVLFALQSGEHVKGRLRLRSAKVKGWRIVAVSEKHDPRAWHPHNNRVFRMLSANMPKKNIDLAELYGHATLEDHIRDDNAECCPVPYGAHPSPVAGFEETVTAYLLEKIVLPPGFLRLFSENGLAGRVGEDWNLELASSIRMIPMVMSIDDLAHCRQAGLRKLISDAACQCGTVAGVDQYRFTIADDDTHGTLDSPGAGIVWPKPDPLSKLDELPSHGCGLRRCAAPPVETA